GNIYITGVTSSDNLPVRNPYQVRRSSAGPSGMDAFVVKLNPSGSVILYSTYLGGDDDETVGSIAVDSDGDIYIVGSSKSSSIAGNSKRPGSNWNGYAVKFNPTGASLAYSLSW